ncbi:MAG: hypothetical protein BWY67_01120 [Bacteroidetes bacterium ADurb.Bin397]|nr:MAG: hypothetical protein BWY67_01120 [Bacteroidetes bacterium ADurb.Bin397]
MIVKRYHTSVAGDAIFPAGWQPESVVYGFSAVAQILVVLKFAHAPTPLGHAAGAGNAPRFIAPLHASFAGGAPPLQDGQAEPGHGTQESTAS